MNIKLWILILLKIFFLPLKCCLLSSYIKPKMYKCLSTKLFTSVNYCVKCISLERLPYLMPEILGHVNISEENCDD